MEKTVLVDGQEVVFKATAATPRVYRQAFGRDIYKDLKDVSVAVGDGSDVDSNLSPMVLSTFENIAYCMAMQALGEHVKRESVEDDMADWLDHFSTFSIYKIVPQLMDLWKATSETSVEPKN